MSEKDTKQNKVFIHPEKEEIIKMLLNGESVKSVEAWLKKKHPKKPRLHISYMTLQKFRKEYLNLEGEVLENIKLAKKEQDDNSTSLEAKAILATSSAYQNKLNEIVSRELDADKKLLEMMTLISSRLEYYFNMMNDTSGNFKSGIKEDRMFMDLINTQRTLIQDWKKYVERVADHTVEHNVNVTIVNEQLNVLKNIVFEVLRELEPRLIPLFIEKINSRLLDVNFGTNEYDKHKMLDIIDSNE